MRGLRYLLFAIMFGVFGNAFATQIPSTRYVQQYFRNYCKNPDLGVAGRADDVASQKYVLDTIDSINGDTTFGATGNAEIIATVGYLETLKSSLKTNGNCCLVPWGDNTPQTMSYIAIDAIATPGTIQSAGWRAVAYGDGKYVAMPDTNYTYVMYSTDGLVWTNSPNGTSVSLPTSYGYWSSITYGNGVWVATNFNGQCVYSINGTDWLLSTLPKNVSWGGVVYAEWGDDNGNRIKRFVTAGAGNASKYIVKYSSDGINWTDGELSADLPTTYMDPTIAYGDGKFVIIFGGDNRGYNNMVYSIDGITWISTKDDDSQITLPISATWQSVAYGDGTFVTVAGGNVDTKTAAYSHDGINWVEAQMPSMLRWQSVAYGDGKFVAVAANGTNIAYSMDGKNWTEFNSSYLSNGYNSIAYGSDGKFVTVGSRGAAVIEFGDVPDTNYWVVGDGCSTAGADVTAMCTTVYAGGRATCSNSACSCARTHLMSDGTLGTSSGSAITVPHHTFTDNDACNAECANLCADNAANNTDGIQKQLICGN